jgi:ADP-heptose:LPS heptosyltransferase
MSDRKRDSGERHPERGNRTLRLVDRYVGISLILALRILKHRRGLPADRAVRRAAFLHSAAIGDTVISSAVIQDFRKAHPSSRITLFCGSSNYEVACMIPGVDEVIRLPITSPLSTIRLIRGQEPFDIWFDLGPWPRLNAIYSFFAPASLNVGFRTERQYRHYLYDIIVEHSSMLHEIENYRAILHAAGIRDTTSIPTLNAPSAAPRPRNIVVHMFPGGSRSYLKEWPEARWVDLLEQLTRRQYTISLTGTEANRARAEKVRSLIMRKELVEIAAGGYSLKDLSGLLKASGLTISVDTGIMHLASALGCNLVALHGPTSPDRWGPLNSNAVALWSPRVCSPCLNLGFEDVCGQPSCMEQITAEEVLAASLRLLE